MSNSQPDVWTDLHRKIRERKAKEKRYQTYSCNSFKTFRRCNTCGNIYDKRDFNVGFCPLCQLEKAVSHIVSDEQLEEIYKEIQDRREESA